jgi:hypothetical protein
LNPPEFKIDINSLGEIQKYLRSFVDPEEREIAEAAIIWGRRFPILAEKKHIVVLIHGINTDAEWQEALAEQIRTECNIEAIPIGYGNFKAWRFLFPVITRKKPISVVVRELRNIRNQNPNADISVIAHSFGTFVLSKILEEETDFSFFRIQLCGAIIDTEYRWDKVANRIKGLIINDVGSKDIWPILAKNATWGYGETGTFGFKKTHVRDRHFNLGHSDFMTKEHFTKYWRPWLVDGQIVASEWTMQRKAHGIKYWFLRNLPLKFFVWVVIPLAFIYCVKNVISYLV